jgi:hypothetical protein
MQENAQMIGNDLVVYYVEKILMILLIVMRSYVLDAIKLVMRPEIALKSS